MVEKISTGKLKNRMEKGDILLIDVLEPDTYREEHIRGAINIPLERIASEAKERFEKDEGIVVYCSGPDCSASPDAAKKLDEMGFENVYHYEGGKKKWKEAGYPMESD